MKNYVALCICINNVKQMAIKKLFKYVLTAFSFVFILQIYNKKTRNIDRKKR